MKKEKISWEKFNEGINILTKKIKKSKFKANVILALPRGGLPIATALAHKLGIERIEINVEVLDNSAIFDKTINTSNVLIVDDVSDTGTTILKNYPSKHVCKIATLHYKPTSRVRPDFFAYITNNWIQYPWEVK